MIFMAQLRVAVRESHEIPIFNGYFIESQFFKLLDK